VAMAGTWGIGRDAVETDCMMSPFGMSTLIGGFLELTGWQSNADL